MEKQDRIESIRAVLEELSRTMVVVTICVDRLQELVAADDPRGNRCLVGPQINPDQFCVVWRRRRCPLGHTTSYRLMERLLRRPNHYVSHARLCDDVWHGEDRSAETIRSAVRQLKLKLVASGMHDLAKAIRAEGRHYGLILRRD